MTKKMTSLKSLILLCIVFLMLSFVASAAIQAATLSDKSVDAGSLWIVPETTSLNSLTIAEGASIKHPPGYSLSMTVDGVETAIEPGKYQGNIVLTLIDVNIVKFSEKLTHHFHQAVYLDRIGVRNGKSVLSAAGNFVSKDGVLTGLDIKSSGENFNGIYAVDGTHTIKGAKIDFNGDGGNDFAGFGAAVMSTGKNTTLILDGAEIDTQGVVRSAVVAADGSNMIVKNSTIRTREGKLPEDYVDNATPGEMKAVPWILGIRGNCRATNVLGNNTTSTYINSSVSAEGWGVLSVDQSQDIKLTAINSKIAITGTSGYGSYSIGNAFNSFYGCEINVPDYGVIIGNGGGNTVFGASTPEIVTKLNNDLKLGLTADEMAALTPAQTVVKSGRFGIMLRGDSTVKITDGTIFDTGETIFLEKGGKADITVDGSKGAQLNTKNGIILQMMDMDLGAENAQMSNGKMVFAGIIYNEPTGTPAKTENFDVSVPHTTDLFGNFSNIELKGDFYNGVRTYTTSLDTARTAPYGKNMVLTFKNSSITGIISASVTRHAKDSFGAEDYMLVGEVKNTPSAAINNGAIVFLSNTTWTVTGTSYLTSLTIGDGSKIAAPKGRKVSLTVDGLSKPIKAGAYKGVIVLTVK